LDEEDLICLYQEGGDSLVFIEKRDLHELHAS